MRETIARITGSTGLYLFALCLWLSSAAAYCALGLMFISCCLQSPIPFQRLKSSPLIILFLTFLVFLVLQSIWLQKIGVSTLNMKHTWDWLSLWLFLLIALHIRADEKRLHRCLILAVSGLFIALFHYIVFDIGWSSFWDSLQQDRYGFFFSQNEAGHYSAALSFGFLLFGPRLLKRKRNDSWTSTVPRALFWAAGLGLALEMLLLSGSRASWLAFALASVLFLPWFFIIELRAASQSTLHLRNIWLLLFVGLISMLLFANLNTIKTRIHYTLDTDSQFLHQVFSLDFRDRSFLNWGENFSKGFMIRTALSYYGGQLIAERPWVGWGTEVNLPHLLAEKTGMQKFDRLQHLHNGFVILPARFGLIGSSLYFLAAVCILSGIVSARRSGIISRDTAFFLSGTLLITALVSAFNFRWTQMDFRFFWLLLAGMAATGRKEFRCQCGRWPR